MKIASSATKEGLEKLAGVYFASVCTIEGDVISNSKGPITSFKVIQKKNKFILETK